jgi:hypothetical protein
MTYVCVVKRRVQKQRLLRAAVAVVLRVLFDHSGSSVCERETVPLALVGICRANEIASEEVDDLSDVILGFIARPAAVLLVLVVFTPREKPEVRVEAYRHTAR